MANNAGRIIRYAAHRAVFPLRDTSGTLITGASGLDSEISIDGGTFADTTNESTEIGTTGIYYLDLTAAEMTGENHSVIVKSSSAVTTFLNLPVEGCLTSGVASAATNSSVTLASTSSATDDFYNGNVVEIVRGTGTGQSRTIIDYTGASKVATVDRVWIVNPDSTSVYVVTREIGLKLAADMIPPVNVDQIKTTSAAATALEALYSGGLLASSISDATPSATEFDAAAGLSTTNDVYNGQLLVMTSGSATGLAEQISDYVGATRTITLRAALTIAPSNGDEFVILGRII